MIDDQINLMINDVTEHRLGLDHVEVHQIPYDTIQLKAEERFRIAGIQYDTILSVSPHSTFNDDDYGDSPDVKGITNFYTVGSETKSAVFILENEPGNSVRLLERYVALIHELGHVDDMQKGLNIKFDGSQIDIIKAEGYAEVFALKYFDKDKNNRIFGFIKAMYAKSLLDRKNENDTYREIHKQINTFFRDTRLKKWIKAQ